MKNKRKAPPPEKGAPKWMVTFSDLVTLILVFFILLFSMSQIDIVKFKAVAQSFKQANILDFSPSIVEFENMAEEVVEKKNSEDENKAGIGEGEGDEEQEDSLDNLLREVQAFLDVNGLEDVIVANRTDRGVVLVLSEKVLFESARATLLPSSYPFLDKVGTLLNNIPNLVKVEGHTDDRPISTIQYPSNWELSSARASSVIRYLISSQNLDSQRFIAVGYGDTRPIVANTNAENWSKNRRVEIIISDPDYNEIVNP